MKICLFTEYFPESERLEISGGVESRAYNIAKELAKTNDVSVLTSWRKGLKREEVLSGIKVIRVGPNHRYSNSAGFLSRIRFALSLIKQAKRFKNIDIIDTYNFTTYIPAKIFAKKINKPVVATYHETWIKEWVKNKGLVTGIPYEIYERIVLKLKFDKIISVSDFTKKRLVMNGVDKKNIVVIKNGVDLQSLKKISGKKFKEPTLCFAGRLVDTKRIDVLIDALYHLKKDYPGIKCKIMGKGPAEEKLKKHAKELGVENMVEFVGFVKKHEEVLKTIKKSHLLCHPSTVEGFGLVLLESIGLGTPYVCSDIPPFKEITNNGRCGEIFVSEDSKDLANKISLLLSNKRLYDRKGEECSSWINQYDWKEIAKKTESLYASVL